MLQSDCFHFAITKKQINRKIHHRFHHPQFPSQIKMGESSHQASNNPPLPPPPPPLQDNPPPPPPRTNNPHPHPNNPRNPTERPPQHPDPPTASSKPSSRGMQGNTPCWSACKKKEGQTLLNKLYSRRVRPMVSKMKAGGQRSQPGSITIYY